jgi:cytochrome c biogenesis protein CcdA
MGLLAQVEAQERALAEVLAAELVQALAEVPAGVRVLVLELAQVQVKE